MFNSPPPIYYEIGHLGGRGVQGYDTGMLYNSLGRETNYARYNMKGSTL